MEQGPSEKIKELAEASIKHLRSGKIDDPDMKFVKDGKLDLEKFKNESWINISPQDIERDLFRVWMYRGDDGTEALRTLVTPEAADAGTQDSTRKGGWEVLQERWNKGTGGIDGSKDQYFFHNAGNIDRINVWDRGLTVQDEIDENQPKPYKAVNFELKGLKNNDTKKNLDKWFSQDIKNRDDYAWFMAIILAQHFEDERDAKYDLIESLGETPSVIADINSLANTELVEFVQAIKDELEASSAHGGPNMSKFELAEMFNLNRAVDDNNNEVYSVLVLPKEDNEVASGSEALFDGNTVNKPTDAEKKYILAITMRDDAEMDEGIAMDDWGDWGRVDGERGPHGEGWWILDDDRMLTHPAEPLAAAAAEDEEDEEDVMREDEISEDEAWTEDGEPWTAEEAQRLTEEDAHHHQDGGATLRNKSRKKCKKKSKKQSKKNKKRKNKKQSKKNKKHNKKSGKKSKKR